MATTSAKKNNKEIKHPDLVQYYKTGDDVDQPIYAEQRSNLMLVAGNHYAKKGSRFYNRVRDDRSLSKEQKIRITKNHMQRICKLYENNILSYAPAAIIGPKNENELKDQKSAELNNAVWQDVCSRHKMKQRNREFVQDFTRIGEVHTKVFWDENKGKFLGMQPKPLDLENVDIEDLEWDEETGEPKMPEPEMEPKFSGDLVYERIYGFNLFRAREAKSLDESWFIGHRKMMDMDELKLRVGDDEDKLEMIQSSRDETYLVFDGNNTSYTEASNQCLVLEFFIRPCLSFPQGYYYIYTMQGILWEGELPFGLFPIVSAGFDEVPTNPRSHSIIKQLRPYQAELNRMASSAAETQITIGQDKVFIQAGTKLQNGGTQPGVNAYTVAGNPPTILPGRTGEQWFTPIKECIDEMYLVANLAEDNQEKPTNQDPYSMLFQSIEQKKKYVIYVTKIMQFLTEVCELSLSLIKEYISDDALIPMIGRSEMVNIKEFKTTTPLNYTIKVESGTEDMETKMGKQLMFNHVIQYVGQNLDQKQLGRLIRTAPYANGEQAFEDLTVDYDNATNMILALDRGEQVFPNLQDDTAYMLKRIVSRTRKADFKQLPPQIQQAYQNVYNQYIQIQAKQQEAIQEAQRGFIPMTGYAVVCDIYVPVPGSMGKTQRARVPYDALNWLLQQIEKQGMSQEGLSQLQGGTIADIAQHIPKSQQMGLHPQQPQGGAGEPVQPPIQPA